MRTGIDWITEERERQIVEEGFSAEHDDQHNSGDLARAAMCYTAIEPIYVKQNTGSTITFRDPFPFSKRKVYPDRIRELAVSGALIAAEIDRLLRLEEQEYLAVRIFNS